MTGEKTQKIPDIVVARLPQYLRALTALREKAETASSKELGERLGFSASQIRKDLSLFGEFGKQGTGYNIDFLTEQIRGILNIDREWNMVLVGCGHVGQAILDYSGFRDNGFRIVAAVDVDPTLIGRQISPEIRIRDIREIESIIRENDIRIAMLTVPAEAAQETAEKLVSYRIKGILTYAPAVLNLPEDIRVGYIDPVSSLQHITYYLQTA